MPEQVSGLPAAGWYGDPMGIATARWWDGANWTSDVRDPQVADPAATTANVPQTRKQLRERVGSLTVGATGHDDGLLHRPSAVAVMDRDPARPQGVSRDGELVAHEHAPQAAGYAPRQLQPVAPAESLTWRGGTQSVAGWFLATAPLWILVPGALIGGFFPALDRSVASLASFGIGLALTVLLAFRDGKRQRANGYRPTSAAWALVPLVYFILRVVRTGPRSVPMLVVWSLLQALMIGLALWAAAISAQAAMHAAEGQVAPQSNSSSTGEAPGLAPPPAHVLTDDERAYDLTHDGFTAELAAWVEQDGHRLGEMFCEPFATTSAGTFASCRVQIDGDYFAVILVATPDDPLYAWDIESSTPYAPTEAPTTTES